MPIEQVDVATCLGTALLLGATIGFERQWRQRLIGLRTNTLVDLGAAAGAGALAGLGQTPRANCWPSEPRAVRDGGQMACRGGYRVAA
jgi:hypothetical protein